MRILQHDQKDAIIHGILVSGGRPTCRTLRCFQHRRPKRGYVNDTNRFLHVRGNLLGHLTIELGAKVIVEGSVAGKIINRGGRREVLSHLGCRSHRIYYAI